MISRPLWATYIVTPEQKSSGILISELFEVRKWVVEKFHGISPGLLLTRPCRVRKRLVCWFFCPSGRLSWRWSARRSSRRCPPRWRRKLQLLRPCKDTTRSLSLQSTASHLKMTTRKKPYSNFYSVVIFNWKLPTCPHPLSPFFWCKESGSSHLKRTLQNSAI